MSEGVQTQTTEHLGSAIAEVSGHPAVRDLMQSNGEQSRDCVDRNLIKKRIEIQWLHSLFNEIASIFASLGGALYGGRCRKGADVAAPNADHHGTIRGQIDHRGGNQGAIAAIQNQI